MPQVRVDPLTGLKTIIAGERADRPGAGFDVPPDTPIDPATDPFLPGHEDQTPPEVHAERPDGSAPDTPGWTVRVVPEPVSRRSTRWRARPRTTPIPTCSRPSPRRARTRSSSTRPNP